MASLDRPVSFETNRLDVPIEKSGTAVSVRPITPSEDNKLLRRTSSQRKHKHNDYSCYIYVNNKSEVDFQLVKSEAKSGQFANGTPPQIIEANTNVLIELTDPKGLHGSEGSCTYRLYHPQKSNAITFNLKFGDPYWARDDNYLSAVSHYPKHLSLDVLDYQSKGHPFIAHVEIKTLEVVGLDRRISHRSQRSMNTTKSSLTSYSSGSDRPVPGVSPLPVSDKETMETSQSPETKDDFAYRLHSKKDSAVGLDENTRDLDIGEADSGNKQHNEVTNQLDDNIKGDTINELELQSKLESPSALEAESIGTGESHGQLEQRTEDDKIEPKAILGESRASVKDDLESREATAKLRLPASEHYSEPHVSETTHASEEPKVHDTPEIRLEEPIEAESNNKLATVEEEPQLENSSSTPKAIAIISPPQTDEGNEDDEDDEDEKEHQQILINEPKYSSSSLLPKTSTTPTPTPTSKTLTPSSSSSTNWTSIFKSRNTHLGIVAMIFLTSWGYTATRISGGLLSGIVGVGRRRH